MLFLVQVSLDGQPIEQMEWDRELSAAQWDELCAYVFEKWQDARVDIRSFTGAEAEALSLQPFAEALAKAKELGLLDPDEDIW